MRDQAGSAVVEFALVLPLLLLLLFGIVEFSIALYDKAVITNASREAARAGVMFTAPRMSSTAITNVATNYVSNYLISFSTPAPISVTMVPSDGCASIPSGSPLNVTLSYTYSGLALGKLVDPLGGITTLSAATTMDCE